MATDMLLAAGNHRALPDQASPDRSGTARPAPRAAGASGQGLSRRLADASGVLDLRALVARQVVPRLRAAFDGGTVEASQLVALADPPVVGPDEVEALVECLLRADFDGAVRCVDAGRACGRPLGRLYVELLMPAALRLARLLADDLCDSTQATLASCNLQLILRRYADDFQDGGRAQSGLRALLVTTPLGAAEGAGLQIFGLLFAAEFFRRDGWDVWTERSLGSDAFRDVVLRQWFDLVEVLATESSDLDAVASGIRQIRRGAPNPRVAVVACGQVFAKHPEYVRMIGADRSASDPLASLPHARELIAGSTQRRRLS